MKVEKPALSSKLKRTPSSQPAIRQSQNWEGPPHMKPTFRCPCDKCFFWPKLYDLASWSFPHNLRRKSHGWLSPVRFAAHNSHNSWNDSYFQSWTCSSPSFVNLWYCVGAALHVSSVLVLPRNVHLTCLTCEIFVVLFLVFGFVSFLFRSCMIISRGSGLILVCPCIRVCLSWADKTSVLPLFQWSQTGITVGADTLRGTLQVAYGIIFFFCSDEEKMTYEITIEML